MRWPGRVRPSVLRRVFPPTVPRSPHRGCVKKDRVVWFTAMLSRGNLQMKVTGAWWCRAAFWLMCAATTPLLAANWPAWRGPGGSGVATEKNLPLRWSTNENVRWCAPLPDRGNSTPIVWGGRVFVTQSLETESRRTVMCFDRRVGKLLWQSGVTGTEKELSPADNPPCTPSPVTDGRRVIAWFGSPHSPSSSFSSSSSFSQSLVKSRTRMRTSRGGHCTQSLNPALLPI